MAVLMKPIFHQCLFSLTEHYCKIMISALVPCQLGEKIVNYPTRPVDNTTDLEGTTNLPPSQAVCNDA